MVNGLRREGRWGGVEGAAATEDDEVDVDAAFGEALGDGEGLLLGASVAEVVL